MIRAATEAACPSLHRDGLWRAGQRANSIARTTEMVTAATRLADSNPPQYCPAYLQEEPDQQLTNIYSGLRPLSRVTSRSVVLSFHLRINNGLYHGTYV